MCGAPNSVRANMEARKHQRRIVERKETLKLWHITTLTVNSHIYIQTMRERRHSSIKKLKRMKKAADKFSKKKTQPLDAVLQKNSPCYTDVGHWACAKLWCRNTMMDYLVRIEFEHEHYLRELLKCVRAVSTHIILYYGTYRMRDLHGTDSIRFATQTCGV